MPQVDIFGIIAADEEVEQTIAIIVEPNSGVGVDPRRQSGLLAYSGKPVAVIVVKQLRTTPFDEEQIFVAIVVVVTPYRAHRNAGAGLVHVGEAHLFGNIFECAIMHVSVEVVFASLFAIG